jgi:hypothetical protein
VNREFKDTKINRSDANNYLSLAFSMPIKGKVSLVDNHMTDIIKHDYLRNSIEQRVERQALYNEYIDSYKKNSKVQGKRHTKAS